MSGPRFRWVDPDLPFALGPPAPMERPEPGQVLVRLWPTREVPADGAPLVGARLRDWRMSIETHDGRSLVARLPNEGDEYEPGKPQIPVDAEHDLAELLMEAWEGRTKAGRRSEQSERIGDIIERCREMGAACTKRGVAASLGRVNDDGEPTSPFNRDVKAAGKWAAIRRAAGLD